MSMTAGLFAALVWSHSSGVTATPPLPPTQETPFDRALRTTFEKGNVPGAAVAVIRNGKVVFAQAFGFADEAKKTPFRTDMQFEIGSLSKQFTATALLMLVRDGKLRLGEKLGGILPDLPETWRTATIEQTLHHMSGIPDYEEIAGYDFYNRDRKPEEIIASANSKPLDFPHGGKFSYSNTGYFVLSLVLEKRSGLPVGKFLENRIFTPLGMTETFAETIPDKLDMPQGYHSRSGSRKPQPKIAWTSTLGAGGLVSTLRDLGKWDAALYTEKLLPAALRDKVWETTKTTGGEDVDYGFGWVMSKYRGVPRQGHSGQTNGFTCVYDRFPTLKTSVIAFTNTYGGNPIFPMRGLAVAHFTPEVSYLSLAIPSDPDPAQTAKSLRALRQAALAEGDMADLMPGIKDFATKPEFAKDREEIKPMLDSLKSFKFLRKTMRKTTDGRDLEEYFYRHDFDGGQVFWTLRFLEGKLGSMNWEIE